MPDDKELLKKTISGRVISDLIHDKRLTQTQVAKDLHESEQVISNYAKGKRYISADFAIKWERKYGERLIDLIDNELIKSTNVEDNITPARKPSGNMELASQAKETFYRDLIEKNDEYSILPRAVLKDYKIVPDKIIDVIITSNENEKNALKRSMESEKEALIKDYERVIQGQENKIARLEKENEDLRRQIPGQNQG